MNESGRHSIAGLFVYLLLAVFALMSLALVLLGIKTYSAAAEKAQAHNTERILTNYVRTLLRGCDGTGELYTETVDGLEVLTLKTEEEGETYYTRLYVYENHLSEQFTGADIDFAPENGESLCDCAAFYPEIEKGLVKLSFTETAGTERIAYVALEAGRQYGE